MKPTPPQLSPEEHQRQRDVIRRSTRQANLAVTGVLLAVLALAAVAIVESVRTQRQRQRADAAESESLERLGQSLLRQAEALRRSGRAGSRAEALAAVSNAAAIQPSLDLRREAIALLALPDLEPERFWPLPPAAHRFEDDRSVHNLDPALQRIVIVETNHDLVVHRLPEFRETLRFNLRESTAGQRTVVELASLRFSPAGRYLVATFFGGGLAVWETTSGRLAFSRGLERVDQPLVGYSLSSDDRWLALTEPQSVTNLLLADLTSGRVEGFAPGPVRRQVVRLDPAGARLALLRESALEIWDRTLNRRMDALPLEVSLITVQWDAAGRRLALGDVRGDIRLWEPATGHVQLLPGHAGGVTRLAFSPDGAWLASTALDGTSRLWDLARAQPTLSTAEGQVSHFDAASGRLGFEQRGLGFGLWRIQAGLGHRVLRAAGGRPEAAYKLDLTADGRWLAWAKADSLHVWDLDAPGPSWFVPLTNLATTFWQPSRAGLFLLFHDRIEVRTVGPGDAVAGEAIRLGAPAAVPMPAGFAPRMAVVSGDGQTLAVAGADRRVAVLRVGRSEPQAWLAGECNPVGPLGSGSATGSGRMALDPAGRWLATCDMYQTPGPHVWDARTGALIQKLPTGTATVGFSPDGRWLATCGRDEIALWTTDAWANVWRVPRAGQPPLEGVLAFNGDGSQMVVARSHQLVQQLDTRTGAELASFTAPDLSAIGGLRFSADGRRIVVGLENNAFKVWDLPPIRAELAKLGLDWGPSAAMSLPRAPGARQNGAGPLWMLLIGSAGVLLATVIAVLALRRHRRLIHEFVQSEATAQARQRELEMARVELMHSQKMKALGTLAAGIAHDFNNLLSVIRMSNQLIGRATQGTANVAEEVGNIEEAVLQGKQVVASMLGYSRERPEADGVCDVDEVVEETVSLLSREFLSGIELTLALDREAPPVCVGRGRIEQILLNLVVNASEAMKGRGRLEIGVRTAAPAAGRSFVLRPRPAARFVELAVADSGPGMAPEILPRIFEPFFTTKTTGTRQGTGLGLSMVYTIAEQAGLGLAVESAPGRGAAFRVWLPACAPDAQFPAAAGSAN